MKRFCVLRFFSVGGWCRSFRESVSSFSEYSPDSLSARVEVTNELRTLGLMALGDIIYIGGKFYLFKGCNFEELPLTHETVQAILRDML
jgi:hypothetical protein